MSNMLHIAVLGDLHGHFPLAYRVLKRWEREHARTLDLILQVGDLGAFPPPFRLDKATKRFAEHDSDELGLAVRKRRRRAESDTRRSLRQARHPPRRLGCRGQKTDIGRLRCPSCGRYPR
jgi:hypothetical protein